MKDQGLRAVGQPKLDDINLNEEKVLRYTATVEVLPDIALDARGCMLTREVRVVTEADVERELHDLQNRHISLVSITEDRPVQEGDYVLNQLRRLSRWGTGPGHETENYALVVGLKSVIESVEQGLIACVWGKSGDCGAVSRNLSESVDGWSGSHLSCCSQ